MALCARAIRAKRGFIYLRGEYNFLKKDLNRALATFHRWLGRHKVSFEVSIFSGSGAYVCGEETALFESMEGKRGEPRNKPPYPTAYGLLGRPTVINNVETFVYAAMIMEIGSETFKKLGTQDSRGAKVFCVSGDTPRPGIYELELGMTVSEFVRLFGDGHTKAVQVGGSSGFCVSRRDFDKTILGFEGIPTGGAVILFNSSRSMYHVLVNFLEFFCEESCGQCTPCRVGCQQLLHGIEAIKSKTKPKNYLRDLQMLAATMRVTAKCGLGQSVGNAFNSITTNYVEELYY
jgi:[NiFe] hydrogenase diaphorase moiety large subunit